MKIRIEFTGGVDVYTDGEDFVPEDAEGWVHAALLRGDKHASSYTTWLGEVTSIKPVGDDE